MSYLRLTKGIHNFIYVISPQMDVAKAKNDLLFRWPGDGWVDFLGMDCYHGLNTEAFVVNVKNLVALSKEKKKPCGVTETGLEGIQNPDGTPVKKYWTQQLLMPLTLRGISMVVMWRNAYDPLQTGKHFYAVYKGHASEADFITMYQSPLSLFSNDLPAMYQTRTDVIVE